MLKNYEGFEMTAPQISEKTKRNATKVKENISQPDFSKGSYTE